MVRRKQGETEKQRQKAEFACIEAVARATGRSVLPEDEANQWPDGWLEGDGKREPVEVVAAFKRPSDEDPKEGSSWLRYWKQGKAAARAISAKMGEAVSWHVGEDGFRLMDEATRLPQATAAIKQDEWVLQAVHQKIAKNYASGPPPPGRPRPSSSCSSTLRCRSRASRSSGWRKRFSLLEPGSSLRRSGS